MGERRSAYRVLVGKPERRRQGVVGWIMLKLIFMKRDGDMDWINLARDRARYFYPVNAAMHLRVLQNAGTVSFTGRTLFYGIG
jgi:hypothetical protein